VDKIICNYKIDAETISYFYNGANPTNSGVLYSNAADACFVTQSHRCKAELFLNLNLTAK